MFEGFNPVLCLKVVLAIEEIGVALGLEFGSCVTLVGLTELLELVRVFDRLPEPVEQVKLFSRIGVGLLFQLHCVCPGSLRLYERYEQVFALSQVVRGHFALLKATHVSAFEIEGFAQSAQSSCTIRSVSLVIAVSQAMLLL